MTKKLNELQLQSIHEYIYYIVIMYGLSVEELVAYIKGRMLSEANNDKQVE